MVFRQVNSLSWCQKNHDKTVFLLDKLIGFILANPRTYTGIYSRLEEETSSKRGAKHGYLPIRLFY